jgi:hypothetical protein
MPTVGADAAAGKATAARNLTTAASTTSWLGRLPLHGKKRPANSYNEKATTGVDARNRCGGFPPAHCERPGVRAHGSASGNDFSNPLPHDASGGNEHCRCVRRPPTCAYADMNRLKSNEAIRRREFVPSDS